VRLLLVLVTACSSTATAPVRPIEPDLAEPAAPVIECAVHAEPVSCEPAAPGAQCERQKPTTKSTLGGTGRLFSAAQTRLARAKDPDACCYLEWTWMACD
jgi:hypothetical protein